MSIGDHLSDVKTLYGVAGCAETSKCLFAAAEKGVDINGQAIDVNSESAMNDVVKFSPFGSLPCLKDVDFYVYGTGAILSYLDDKGFGPSLVPRNGVIRAVHYQWSHIATDVFGPAVAKLSEGNADATAIESVKTILSALEAQLSSKGKRGDYIVGEFCLADIHWAPYVHHCCLFGHSDLVDSLPAVKAWWSNMKIRKSTSKEDYTAYTVLPSMEEVRNNQLRSIHINA